MTDTPTPVDQLTFEAALKELEQIVSELERGEVPLAKSVEQYERGAALKQHCDKLLKEAEARVEKIRLDQAGSPIGSEPLDGG